MTDEQASLIAAALALGSVPRPLGGTTEDEFEIADRVAALARVLYADLRSASREREHADLVERLAFVSGLQHNPR